MNSHVQVHYSTVHVYSDKPLYTCTVTSHILQDGDWRDVTTGLTMKWDSWLWGFPDDREGSDCILQDVYTSKILNYPCLYNPEQDKAACPICEVQRRNFILAGVCLSSAVDTVFVMESPTVFLGYIQTTLMYNVDSARWEIVNTTHTRQVRKIFKR